MWHDVTQSEMELVVSFIKDTYTPDAEPININRECPRTGLGVWMGAISAMIFPFILSE